MATIQAIQTRIGSAVTQLVNADRNNPNTTLSPSDIRANPYMRPKGDNGAVDKNEAQGVTDPFAKSLFEAASFHAGKHVSIGGIPGGFREATMPEWEVQLADLRQLHSHLNAIVAGLETDPQGHVTQAALDSLPATIADYFKGAFGHVRPQPRADAVEKMATVVREAATGVVDWR